MTELLDLNGNKNCVGFFLGHPYHIWSKDIFLLTASLLVKHFSMYSPTLIFFLFVLKLFSMMAKSIHTFIHGPFSEKRNQIAIFKNANKLYKSSWKDENIDRNS